MCKKITNNIHPAGWTGRAVLILPYISNPAISALPPVQVVHALRDVAQGSVHLSPSRNQQIIEIIQSSP